ncbi:CTLH/CRA C-terminal to lish motif domain-containing protein [Lyophyllum atratum]|nr:CTLH/CRA C-terminal to lish motif domain-containing protein [Lyophyllum atratum]
MLPTTTVSELLGYTSIACWLGAQFPQVLENIRRQSCEGLALPFLGQLASCISTTPGAQNLLRTFGHARPLPSASRSRRMSIDRGAARYRTLSAVAANVAASAALAAQQDEQADHRRRWQGHSTDHLHDSRVGSSQDMVYEDDVDENALAALADSFHSEAGHESRKKRLSWSIERYRRRSGSLGGLQGVPAPLHSAHQPIPFTDPLLDAAGRGRPLERDLDSGIEIEPQVASPNRRSSRVRGATMVFLSAWALFGIGTLAGSRHGFTSSPGPNVGKVLVVRGLGLAESAALHMSSLSDTNLGSLHEIKLYDGRTFHADAPIYEAIMTEPVSERVIGRMFAWLCTTLYLTSRLPQIWKNFVRKSVEGLSMYLFVFAFLGNVFYVASILSSPKMQLPPAESAAFVKESIPYLLGSAGTLVFDITIVAQSFIYRPRHRRHSALYSSRMEEEAGLLTGESIARHPSDSTSLDAHHASMSSFDSMRLGPKPGTQLASSTPYQLRALVLDYLCHQCYPKTAKAFARDSTVHHLDADGDEILSDKENNPTTADSELPEKELKQVELREQIQKHILSGRVDEATSMLNEHFPSVLAGPVPERISEAIPYACPTSVDPAHLTLNLRILSFIEACRTVPLPYPKMDGDTPEPPHTSPQQELQAMDVDSSPPFEQQLRLLSKARKLLGLAEMLTKPGDRDLYLKELTNVGGLLAYKVPEHSTISKYLSQERREAVADQINRAILDRVRLPPVSSLELLTRYTSTVWSFAHQIGAKPRPGALIPPTTLPPTSQKESETVPPFDLEYFLNLKT